MIKTPFVLFIEWDGYVIEPRAWHPSFREYDYIGAKWADDPADGMRVGNSGFCLQSKRLLDALADPRFVPLENQNVDLLICRTYRPELLNASSASALRRSWSLIYFLMKSQYLISRRSGFMV